MKKIIIALFLTIPYIVIAQESEEEIELSTVTVSASLQPLPVAKTGRNIIAISGEKFQQLPVHSIDDLLRYIPGVEVQQRGPAGSQSDIVLRGGTFQQVLIVLDGIRLNDPNTGHFNSYIPIHPREIERIEVLKGASSAIYGSEAVGGVIHIITKSFNADKHTEIKNLEAAATAGEYGLWGGSLSGYWKNKKTAVFAGIISNNANGQQQRGTKGFFNNHTFSASANHHINNHWSIAFRSAYDSRDFAAQNFYTSFASDTAQEKVSSFWNHASVNFYKGKHKAQLSAGYKSVNDLYQYNPSSIANDNKSQLLQLLLTDHYQINENTVLTGGIQFQNRNIRSNDRGNHSLKQTAAFLILHQQLNQWSFSPSARIDYGGNRGSSFIPQLNISYHKNKWQLRGSIGTTIRDADFTERFNNYNKALVTGGSVGNPDLKAEKSLSYEIGADYFANKNIKISTSFFQRNQSELIDWVTTPYSNMPRQENLSPGGTFALAKNISEVTTSGWETDILYQHTLNEHSHLFTSLGVLWLYSESPNATPSFYISSHARFLTNWTLHYTYKNLSVGLTAIYKSRPEQEAAAIHAKISKDYFLLNAQAGLDIAKNKLHLFIRADNTLNADYSDLLGSVMPGRWIMGGVSFKW